jgi:acyl carrier protein
MNMTTLDSLKELAAKQFGGDPASIDANAGVDTLGLDSLGFLEFLFELEDHFGISIPQERVTGVRTLAELATVIDELLAAKDALPA